MIYQSYSLSSVCTCAGAYSDNVTMWRCDKRRFSRALHMCRSLLWQCDNVTLWQLAVLEGVAYVQELIVTMWQCDVVTTGLPVNAHQSLKAMLLQPKSYAFGCLELCFRTRKGMLSEAKNNAFDVQKQCSRGHGTMLWSLRSNVLELTEQCFRAYGAITVVFRISHVSMFKEH